MLANRARGIASALLPNSESNRSLVRNILGPFARPEQRRCGACPEQLIPPSELEPFPRRGFSIPVGEEHRRIPRRTRFIHTAVRAVIDRSATNPHNRRGDYRHHRERWSDTVYSTEAVHFVQVATSMPPCPARAAGRCTPHAMRGINARCPGATPENLKSRPPADASDRPRATKIARSYTGSRLNEPRMKKRRRSSAFFVPVGPLAPVTAASRVSAPEPASGSPAVPAAWARSGRAPYP